MPDGEHLISENSRRIARNTVFLYFRMLLLMLIGLFTTRVILHSLGFDDYGIYGVVGSVVALANIVSNSVSQALSRYIAAGLAEGDGKRSSAIFSTGVIVMGCLAALVVLLVETVGIWYLHAHVDIPAGRMEAAEWVMHCSLGVMVLSLLSVPFNATIMAHEKMSAYAYISILEAVLKLSVALAVFLGNSDKLKLYAILMLGVALVVRMTYGIYCRRHFEETRGRLVFEKPLLKEMLGFAGWNFLGSGAYLINTQGVNLVVNAFFGVAVNAARGVAGQIENIVRQFVSNIVVAINPQITKQYVAGNREYAFELVNKGAKYAGIIVLFFLVPYVFEADRISLILFGRNPEGSGVFSALVIACVLVDLAVNTLVTLELATGNIKRYYIITSAISILALPLTYLVFAMGAPAWSAYAVFLTVYLLVDIARLVIIRSQTGFSIRTFMREVVLKISFIALCSTACCFVCTLLIPDGWTRFMVIIITSAAVTALVTCLVALTPGERTWMKSMLTRTSRS